MYTAKDFYEKIWLSFNRKTVLNYYSNELSVGRVMLREIFHTKLMVKVVRVDLNWKNKNC